MVAKKGNQSFKESYSRWQADVGLQMDHYEESSRAQKVAER